MTKTKQSAHYKRHNGPWDRGSADNYYRRPFNPHYFKADTSPLLRVSKDQMTEAELLAYKAGWDDNEASGDFKIWSEQ